MVSGQFKRSGGKIVENVNGLTAATGSLLGQTTLRTKATWTTYDGTLQFCVTSITRAGYTYNVKLNKATCVKVAAKPAGRRDTSQWTASASVCDDMDTK